ncbi:MAG: thioredoxin family protein [Treponema sp.]|nr:thioredoxin family protein [Treponema sp.]
MSECCCGVNCESVTKEVNGKIESIKVLGSGCKNCHAFHQNVIDALAEMNLAVNLEYVTDMQKIMEAGVMSMPALMVNDKVVSCGKVLKVDEVKKLLSKV